MDIPNNKWVIYMVVGAIILMAIETVTVNCIMSYVGREPSRGLDLLTGGLVGSLTALLVKTTPTQGVNMLHSTPVPDGTPPTEVVVTNTPEEPVPTEEKQKTRRLN